MEEKRFNAGKLSLGQKSRLVEFLRENPILLTAKLDSVTTAKDLPLLWEDAASILNAITGSRKDWKGWRKCWQYMKNNVKSKAASTKRHRDGTGGGPPLKIFMTEDEIKIQQMLVPSKISGHDGIKESAISLEFDTQKENIGATAEPQNQSSHRQQEEVACDIENAIGSQSTPFKPIVIRRRERFPKKNQSAAAAAADKICTAAEEKLRMKQKYYDKKLELMEKAILLDIEQKSRIADAMEKIANKI